jgi:hypothetical protein
VTYTCLVLSTAEPVQTSPFKHRYTVKTGTAWLSRISPSKSVLNSLEKLAIVYSDYRPNISYQTNALHDEFTEYTGRFHTNGIPHSNNHTPMLSIYHPCELQEETLSMQLTIGFIVCVVQTKTLHLLCVSCKQKRYIYCVCRANKNATNCMWCQWINVLHVIGIDWYTLI